MFRHRRTLVVVLAVVLAMGLVLRWAPGPGAQAQDAVAHPDAPPGALEPQAALGSSFTYQGQLTDGGVPATGPCDFRFLLYDTEIGGSQVGPIQERADVELSDGRFAVNLNFAGSAFTGETRWLEIAVQCAADSGYVILGRQSLKAAPYALYAKGAPWSGLRGVPADLADGDENTTYSAGAGLSLVGTEFRVSPSYRLPQTCGNGQIAEWSGSAWACGNDDVGTGGGGGDITAVDAGTGLLGGGPSGDVTLSADTGYLQRRVSGSCASGNAIRAIGGAGGVTCESLAGGNDHDHLGQTWTGTNTPLKIEGSFGDDPSAPLMLTNTHVYGTGLYVSSTGVSGNGIEVGTADIGVKVNKTRIGVVVEQPGGYGVAVMFPDRDGLYVCGTGDQVSCVADPEHHHGLEVGWPQHDGVHVIDAGRDGLRVESAGENGVRVNGAGLNGAEIWDTTYDGVQVNNAGRDGVRADTSKANQEWGFNTSDKLYAGAGWAGGGPLAFVAQNGDAGELAPGDVVAAIGLAKPFAEGANSVPLVGRASAESGAGAIGVVLSRFVADKEVETIKTANGEQRPARFHPHSVAGPIEPGDHLLIVVLGVAQVKVAPGIEIQAGQRLTASDLAGHVRALRTEMLNGMPVSEGAPVVGVALAAAQPGDTTIPVFVTLR